MAETNRIKIGVMGASGYTGAELMRLLDRHPQADIRAVTADRHAGKPMAAVYPHLAAMNLPDLVKIDDVEYDDLDVVFCGLPHGTTQEVIAGLPKSLKVVDLSADFRLSNLDTYAEWYGHPHQAPDLQKEAVYGLTEIYRDEIAETRLCANPGCYTTTAQLPLIPLAAAGAIDLDTIIIDAKSGVSGAGRSAKEANLFCEVSEAMHAYGVGKHRHAPEIEQGIARAAGRDVMVTFTPHLVPMNRGILATIYVKMAGDATVHGLRALLERQYGDEPFIHVLPAGGNPATRHVRGSNNVVMSVFGDRRPGHAIIVCTLDNLVKGASGQAVQNMNLMMGIPETVALEQQPMFP